MSHENGRVFADKSDIERLDRRIDEQAEIEQRRIGELESTWIRLEGHFGAIRAAVGDTKTEVNGLRIGVENRLGRIETLLQALLMDRGAKAL